ncbi:MAG: methyltransferase domain-containing protein [Polyangiaceae bacterium]|nr:methyltransferase domain-containing protein [Polyangiaceae bacterium]
MPKRPPPPPPKRPTSPGGGPVPSGPATSAPAKRLPEPPPAPRELTGAPRQPRAWWEEVFGEDFSRAVPRVPDQHIKREVDFLEESLGVAAGGVILDLACGGGQHAVELAGRGYGVVGYDLSLHQLALAADLAQEAERKINFMQGDMREMAFEETFDGIYCWNSSFGFFEDEKNAAVAQRIHRALRSGGSFVLDIVNRDFAVAHQPSSVWYEGDGCLCMDDMSVDFISSRVRVKRSLMLDDGRSMECSYSLRLYSLQEIGKLLHEVGFKVTEASGHPATPGTFLGACSPRIIILATKA